MHPGRVPAEDKGEDVGHPAAKGRPNCVDTLTSAAARAHVLLP